MRISDWSSDVCSSDLVPFIIRYRARSTSSLSLGSTMIVAPSGAILSMLSPSINSANTPFGNEGRSEEHTSELQSLMRISYAVFCLKKKHSRSIVIAQPQQQQYTHIIYAQPNNQTYTYIQKSTTDIP